jgi:hypothetical protein
LHRRFIAHAAFGTAVVLAASLIALNPAGADHNRLGIVSWWRAQSNARDSVDGNDGILVNGVGFDHGMCGRAFRFNGSVGQSVQVPDAANLNITGPLTLMAWIRPDVPIARVIDKITAGTGNGYLLDTFPGRARLIAGQTSVIGATTLPLGAWTHVAGTYDGAILRVYVNGALDGTSFGVAPTGTNANPLRIGGDSNGLNTFSGLIDEVVVFHSALAVSDIAAIHDSCSALRHIA